MESGGLGRGMFQRVTLGGCAMYEFLKHLGIFVSMISFFSGIVVLTMNQILCKKEEDPLYPVLRKFHLLFFFYTLIVFFYYYEELFILGNSAAVVTSYLGNITLAFLFISYADVIGCLNGRERTIGCKILRKGCIAYIAIWFVVAVFIRDRSMSYVDGTLGRVLIVGTEVILLCTILLFAREQWESCRKDRRSLFFMAAFLIMALWEIMYDTAVAVPLFLFTHMIKPFNLVILLYFLINVTLMIQVYCKPLFEAKPAEHITDDMLKDYLLTGRERELLQLVLKGRSNQEIAEQLCISNNTVKHHMSSIYKKTETNGRMQLLQKLGNLR
jgi:DNA-binding CsgD family transcriptional regulator